MLKCESCIYLKSKPKLKNGKYKFCYDLGFHEEYKACRNWRPNFLFIEKRKSLNKFLAHLDGLYKKDLDIIERIIKIQNVFIKSKLPHKIGSIVLYQFKGRWFTIFVENIIKIDDTYFIQGRPEDSETTFTLPITSVDKKNKTRVFLKTKLKVRLKTNKRIIATRVRGS